MGLSRIGRSARTYLSRFAQLGCNAKLFLLATFAFSLCRGIYMLLFNLYILSLGYRQDFLGLLSAVSYITAAILAVPMGMVSDRIGRTRALLVGESLFGISLLAIALSFSRLPLILFSLACGVGTGTVWVNMAPFMADNSGSKERPYLFSARGALSTLGNTAGSFIGGWLPSLFAVWLHTPPEGPLAYRTTLLVGVVLALLGIIPFALIRSNATQEGRMTTGTDSRRPWVGVAALPTLLVPLAILSLADGLLPPFINLFFKSKFGTPDTMIGSVLGAAGVVAALGVLVASTVVELFGSRYAIPGLLLTSIPFLLLLGFGPAFALVIPAFLTARLLTIPAFPLYSAAAMGRVTVADRTTLSALLILAQYVAKGFGSWISGHLQASYGFDPIVIAVCLIHVAAAVVIHVVLTGKRAPARGMTL